MGNLDERIVDSLDWPTLRDESIPTEWRLEQARLIGSAARERDAVVQELRTLRAELDEAVARSEALERAICEAQGALREVVPLGPSIGILPS